MTGEKVILEDMLICREQRVQIQNTFLNQYQCPVISFCMNIPGPVKTNPDILSAFTIGKELLLSRLNAAGIPLLNEIEIHNKTGDEFILSANADAKLLKDLTTQIEETHPLGRLFDMDVIDTDGQKLSRHTYRKCIICNHQAQECARARKHSVEEMQTKIDEILAENL